MALLFLDSFDHYDKPTDKYTGGNWANSSGFAPGRHGKALVTNGCLIALGALSKRVIVGGAWYPRFHANTYYTIGDQNSSLLWLSSLSDGALLVAMFGADGEGVGDIVARSDVDLIKQDQWYYIELDVTMDFTVLPNDTVIYHALSLKVILDGLVVIDEAAVGPTIAFTHAPSPAAWNFVVHGSNGAISYIDDFYICDGSGPAPWNAPLGDVQIDVIRPNGAGAVTQWELVGAPANWDATNDTTPDDEATKVRAATAGLSDLYAMEDVNTNNGIVGAQILVCARRTEEGFAQLSTLLRHGGVTTALPYRAITPEFFYRNRDVFVTMPNGDPLTDANLNAMQAGVRRIL